MLCVTYVSKYAIWILQVYTSDQLGNKPICISLDLDWLSQKGGVVHKDQVLSRYELHNVVCGDACFKEYISPLWSKPYLMEIGDRKSSEIQIESDILHILWVGELCVAAAPLI